MLVWGRILKIKQKIVLIQKLILKTQDIVSVFYMLRQVI